MLLQVETSVKSHLVPDWKVTPGNVTFSERFLTDGTILPFLKFVEALPVTPAP